MRAFAQMLRTVLALYGFGPKVTHRRRGAIQIGHSGRRFV